jgi:sarcosine oxidase subunit beta
MGDSSARVAVVGGGAVGTSVLFHLAKRHEVTDAVLLERGQLASGSTSRAVGGVRYTFSHRSNVETGIRNLEVYRNFESHVGRPLEFRSNGYLYVFHSADSEREWTTYRDRYREYDTEAVVLSPAETTEVCPAIDPDEIRGSLWAPDCGHVDPYSATRAMADAATKRGATVETNASVEAIRVGNDSVRTVETDETTYEVDAVVNAAGAWAPAVGRMVGVAIPLDLLVRRVVVTTPVDVDGCPLVIDRERQFYFEREESGSLLVCDTAQDRHDVPDPDAALGDAGYDYYLGAFEKLDRLAPGFGDVGVHSDWAGVQSHTPDGHALLGPTDVDGFFLACGMSGHGVMQAPSVGAAVSDLVVEGETDLFDAEAFSVDRFGRDDRIDPERLP